MPDTKKFKKIDMLETVESIITFIVECGEDVRPADIIGSIVTIDGENYSCIAIERFDLDITEDSVLWAGERFKLFGIRNYFADEEGDDYW